MNNVKLRAEKSINGMNLSFDEVLRRKKRLDVNKQKGLRPIQDVFSEILHAHCPSDEELAAFAEGRGLFASRVGVFWHLVTCFFCQELVKGIWSPITRLTAHIRLPVPSRRPRDGFVLLGATVQLIGMALIGAYVVSPRMFKPRAATIELTVGSGIRDTPVPVVGSSRKAAPEPVRIHASSNSPIANVSVTTPDPLQDSFVEHETSMHNKSSTQSPIVPESFEVCLEDWTADSGVWEVGKSSGNLVLIAHSWGGSLLAGHSRGNLAFTVADTDWRVESVILPMNDNPPLFWQWYSVDSADSLAVKTSDGGVHYHFGVAVPGNSVREAFTAAQDAVQRTQAPGWFIDDVEDAHGSGEVADAAVRFSWTQSPAVAAAYALYIGGDASPYVNHNDLASTRLTFGNAYQWRVVASGGGSYPRSDRGWCEGGGGGGSIKLSGSIYEKLGVMIQSRDSNAAHVVGDKVNCTMVQLISYGAPTWTIKSTEIQRLWEDYNPRVRTFLSTVSLGEVNNSIRFYRKTEP